MLQLHDRRDCIAAHIFDGVLIAQPVRSLDGVVHVPAPVILGHVAQRGTHAALCCDRVAAGRENLGDTGCLQPGSRHAQRGTQTRAARTDNDDIIVMFSNFISLGHMT